MRVRTSLPILCAILLHFVACGSSVSSGGTGGEGSSTGGGNVAGGGGQGPACHTHALKVGACAAPTPLPMDPYGPWDLLGPRQVTAVRAPGAGEPCTDSLNYNLQLGAGTAPEVMIDLADSNGNPLTLGIAAPGFTADAVKVGDVIDVDWSWSEAEWGGVTGYLVLKRDGALVVAVGKNDGVELTIGEGARECYEENDLCGYGEFAMTVETQNAAKITLANGDTGEVDGLSITNAEYFHNYDTSGGCNFGLSVEYLLSVVPTP